MDQICAQSGMVRVQDPRTRAIVELPGTESLAAALAACPMRFALDDAVTDTVTRLAFYPETIVGKALDLVRCPAPSLWLEFRGAARHGVFADTGRLACGHDAAGGQRLGLLIESRNGGRAGTIASAWESTEGQPPDAAPFVIEFDFDTPIADRAAEDGAWAMRITDFPPLEPLFRHVRFRLKPEWLAYYRERCPDPARFGAVMDQVLQPAAEDVPFVAAFLLLMMSQQAVRLRPADLAALNRVRAKRGRTPLLDHSEMMLEIGEAGGIAGQGDGIDGRAPSRLHLVRGHLVRRGPTIFWRNAHMRGRAELGRIERRSISLLQAAE